MKNGNVESGVSWFDDIQIPRSRRRWTGGTIGTASAVADNDFVSRMNHLHCAPGGIQRFQLIQSQAIFHGDIIGGVPTLNDVDAGIQRGNSGYKTYAKVKEK